MPEADVALLENVGDDLLVRLLLGDVAVIVPDGISPVDGRHELPGLARLALDAEPGLGIAYQVPGIGIHSNEADGNEEGEDPRDEADRTLLVREVDWKRRSSL